jgi:hypothetical protein
MGTTFPATAFLPVFDKFDNEFTKLAGELPAWMCKDAVKHRNACLDMLEEWYIGYNNRSETDSLAQEEKVSAVIQAVLDFSRDHHTATRDVATFLLADMFATQANAPPAAAWCVIKFSENPEALARLRREIQAGVVRCGSLAELVRDKKVLDEEFEFLGSAIKETLRLVTSVASIRRVMEDTILGSSKGSSEGVLLKKGEMVYCLTRPTHTDSEIHAAAGEWVPERFMAEFKEKGKTVKNDWMPFGGGSSMCEGTSSTSALANFADDGNRSTFRVTGTSHLPYYVLLPLRRRVCRHGARTNRFLEGERGGSHAAEGRLGDPGDQEKGRSIIGSALQGVVIARVWGLWTLCGKSARARLRVPAIVRSAHADIT